MNDVFTPTCLLHCCDFDRLLVVQRLRRAVAQLARSRQDTLSRGPEIVHLFMGRTTPIQAFSEKPP